MTRRELIEYCLTYPGAVEDYPFKEKSSTIMRHSGNNKWFALILELDGKLCINLKCDPMEADFLRRAYRSVIPAWHMNKIHWNTVVVDGEVAKNELFDMISKSFSLTQGHVKEKH